MNINNIFNEFISKKRLAFTSLIVILVVIMGLFTTYALDVIVDERALPKYDMALIFELSDNINRQLVVPAGKTKVFDMDISNPYTDSVKYGIAYSLVNPTTLPEGVTIAQSNLSKNSAVDLVEASSSVSVSIVVVNESSTKLSLSFRVINGYKNGGELIVPTGNTLVTETYELIPPEPDIIINNMPIPSSGTYLVDTSSCTDAIMTYDYVKKGFKVSNVTLGKNATCTPSVSEVTRTTMANYIINLLGTNTSVASTSNNDGSTLEKINSTLDSAINGTTATATDYRYRGIDPNNYIWFNDELWRIIGVMDQYSHGQTGKQLVKIIRNDSIGGYVYDKSNKNNWPNGSMYSILNTAYYNSINATGETYCYGYSTSEPAKCNFTSGGIKEEYRDMIENVTWYLGGYASADTSANMYKYERSTDTSSTYYYSGNAQTITNTPIGLMYASDYGYAAPSTCTRSLSSYSSTGCSDSDWLKQNYYEWTITHCSSDSSNVFLVSNSGYLRSNSASNGYATRPTLYLDSSVYYISGDGSKTNPYIISM